MILFHHRQLHSRSSFAAAPRLPAAGSAAISPVADVGLAAAAAVVDSAAAGWSTETGDSALVAAAAGVQTVAAVAAAVYVVSPVHHEPSGAVLAGPAARTAVAEGSAS